MISYNLKALGERCGLALAGNIMCVCLFDFSHTVQPTAFKFYDSSPDYVKKQVSQNFELFFLFCLPLSYRFVMVKQLYPLANNRRKGHEKLEQKCANEF